MYKPHVFGVRVGQNVEFVNSDSTRHNVHALPNANQEFNFSQPIQTQKDTRFFTVAGGDGAASSATAQLDGAYAGVLDHPYFAVTSPGGQFELRKFRRERIRSRPGMKSSARRRRPVTLGEKDSEGRSRFKSSSTLPQARTQP